MAWTDQIDLATARRAVEKAAGDEASKTQAKTDVNVFFAQYMGIALPVRLALDPTAEGWFLRAESDAPGTALGYTIYRPEGEELSDEELELVSAGGSCNGPSGSPPSQG